MNWNYDANDYNENSYVVIPEGVHRARISKAEGKTYNSGREGIAITFDISGYSSKVFYNLVFMEEDKKGTNQKLGSLFNSFDIQPSMDLNTWIGKVGAICVKHGEYQGEKQANFHYCINRSKQDSLPAWKEPLSGGSTQETPVTQAQAAAPYNPFA